MGYVAQLAESAGAPIDLAAWVSAAALTPVQKAEVYMAEEQTRAALTPEGAPADLAGWTAIDPKETLGLIDLGPILFPRDNEFENAEALAYRTLESAMGGPTDFAFASNIGSAEVWINGIRVQGALNRNTVRPGLERFRVDLKPGTNHIVVKSTNNNKRWLFCLGTLEPRPPLAVPVAPLEQAPALAAAG